MMNSGRRSFVKGSVAAPLVLTVGPAAARAQSSSLACLNRDVARATSSQPVAMVAVDSDDWLRIKVELLELGIWDGPTLKTISGKHFLGVDRTTYWQLYETGIGSATAAPTSYTTSNCVARRLGERRFALVYVDPTGRRTGYAFETNGGAPVTGSCWTSVAVFRA